MPHTARLQHVGQPLYPTLHLGARQRLFATAQQLTRGVCRGLLLQELPQRRRWQRGFGARHECHAGERRSYALRQISPNTRMKFSPRIPVICASV
jgi:hypothetical protein